jgi:hypothetical protein
MKGSQRGRIGIIKGREDKMERALFKEFKEARKIGKAVGALWLDAILEQSIVSSILNR